MDKENKKVVLAYSGGLDTTYCAIYLKKVKGLEVHALTVNTGGFSEKNWKPLKKEPRTWVLLLLNRWMLPKIITSPVSDI